MSFLTAGYIILSSFLVFFLVFPFLKVLASFIAKEKIKRNKVEKNYDFASIITAYKNVHITKPLVQSLLRQNYDNHLVYLVADACDISDFDIQDERLILLRPEPALNLKAKSIIHGIENFRRDHEYIAVFDGDNVTPHDFLKEINIYVNNGHTAVQGQRTAKNLDTIYACADSTGEFYKNYVERYIPYLIGSSAVISGSGMAVEANLYKAYLASPEIEKGKHLWKKMLQEDKILQNFLLRKNEKIAYAWNAIVFDEKVTSAEAVETQRTRWLYSYFQNIPNSLGILRRGLFNFSFNQLLFGLVTIAPPLFILLFLSVVMAVLGLFVQPIMSIVLIAALMIFAENILLSLYLSKVP